MCGSARPATSSRAADGVAAGSGSTLVAEGLSGSGASAAVGAGVARGGVAPPACPVAPPHAVSATRRPSLARTSMKMVASGRRSGIGHHPIRSGRGDATRSPRCASDESCGARPGPTPASPRRESMASRSLREPERIDADIRPGTPRGGVCEADPRSARESEARGASSGGIGGSCSPLPRRRREKHCQPELGRKRRPIGSSISVKGGSRTVAVSSYTPTSIHTPSRSSSASSVRVSGSSSQ